MNYLGKLCSCHSTDISTDGVKQETTILEAGEGQPCLTCSTDKCPTGFKQHAWRHVCDKCRCARHDHDISAGETVDAVERLGLGITNEQHTSLQASRDLASKLGYTWIPTGLSKQKQVEEYMSQLSDDNVPKASSTGARRRQVQLIVQLPARDLAARFCRQLNVAADVDAFDEFRRTRDANVLDVAQVTTAIKHTAFRQLKQADLPFKGVSISHDLTPKQREENKKLITEAKAEHCQNNSEDA